MTRDETGRCEPPTYFANYVTANLNPDELTLELRRVHIPHQPSSDATLIVVASPTVQEIMQQEPIARIVMTFGAARALKEYLDEAINRVEKARQTGGSL